MEQAVVYSKRATCNRLKVGCVITTKSHILLAEGYNGSVSGHPHCSDVGCLINDEHRCIRTVHAEQNSILNAMKKGVSILDGTAYVTAEPCETCTKLLLQSGITTIIYLKPYSNKYNKLLLESSPEVEVREFEGRNKEKLLRELEEINKEK